MEKKVELTLIEALCIIYCGHKTEQEKELFHHSINIIQNESKKLHLKSQGATIEMVYELEKQNSDVSDISCSSLLDDLLNHCDILIEGNKDKGDYLESFINGVYAVRGKISYWRSKFNEK
jgi:hypothetical protein